MTALAETKEIRATVMQGIATVEMDDIKIRINAAGNVIIFSNELTSGDIRQKPAITNAEGAAGSKSFKINDNGFSVNGVKVELSHGGGFTVHADGEIRIRPDVTLEIGEEMEDGSVFVGLTTDGEHQIFVMPEDISLRGSFNQAREAVRRLNADKKANLGHDDWQIGSAEIMQIVRKNVSQGVLKESFKKTFFRDCYYQNRTIPAKAYWSLSSTRDSLYPSNIATIRFTEGDGFKAGAVRYESDNAGKFGCRPVRLEPVASI